MLSDKIKQVIRTAYKTIGENLPNFNPRKQQTFLIAEIAKTLAGDYDKLRKSKFMTVCPSYPGSILDTFTDSASGTSKPLISEVTIFVNMFRF